jgi:hypothetical protein
MGLADAIDVGGAVIVGQVAESVMVETTLPSLPLSRHPEK